MDFFNKVPFKYFKIFEYLIRKVENLLILNGDAIRAGA